MLLDRSEDLEVGGAQARAPRDRLPEEDRLAGDLADEIGDVLPRGVAACDIGFGEFASLADWELPGRRSRVTPDLDAGRLTVALRRSAPFGRFERGRVTLTADRRWTIDCGRGLADVAIDGRHPAFGGLIVRGGTSRLRVLLGEPEAPVELRLQGGAAHVELVREARIPARLRFGSAFTGVVIDGSRHASGRGGDLTAGGGTALIECVFESSAAGVVLRDA